MKLPTHRTLGLASGLLLSVSGVLEASVYSENFETAPTVNNAFLHYIGGNTGTPKIDFDTWGGTVGSGFGFNATVVDDGSGTNNVMEVDSFDNASRGVGIILDPSRFTGGTGAVYTVSFDVTFFEERGTDTNDPSEGAATFQVFFGKDYDLTETTGARIGLDVGEPGQTEISLKDFGSPATASKFGSSENITGTGFVSYNFTHDGESAVALMFGSYGGGASRFRYQFDNVTVIPETSSSAVVTGLLACAILVRRRAR